MQLLVERAGIRHVFDPAEYLQREALRHLVFRLRPKFEAEALRSASSSRSLKNSGLNVSRNLSLASSTMRPICASFGSSSAADHNSPLHGEAQTVSLERDNLDLGLRLDSA